MSSSDHRYQDQNILTHIFEGMQVVDSKGETIGTVQHVYFGAVTSEEDAHGQGSATAPKAGESEHSFIEDFLKSLSPEETLANPLHEQLLRHGYIRIHTFGLMNAGCFAMPEQIAEISGDDITLNVPHEQLITC